MSQELSQIKQELKRLQQRLCCKDTKFFDNLSLFPEDGAIHTLYVDESTSAIYIWNGIEYVTAVGRGYVNKQTDIKVLLRGAISSGPTMKTTLATSGLLPIFEPYDALGYLRVANKNEQVSSLTVFTTNNITDWILVELRDKNNPSIIKYNKSALLKNNGDVLNLDGVSKLQFENILNDLYYVCIRHRNHLSIMTAEPVNIEDSLDFTSVSTQLFGDDNRINQSGVMSLCGGKTSTLDIASYSLTFGVQNSVAKFLSDNSNGQFNGYSIYDYNFDGTVRYLDAFIPPSTFINSDALFCLNTFFTSNLNVVVNSYLPEQLDLINYVKRSDSRIYDILPKGNTLSRPLTIEGAFRYNTTDKKLEYHNGTTWVQL